MSGVDRSEKEKRINSCKPCMNTVIQTFSHFQDQIKQLNHDKKKLQMELKKSKKEQQKEKQILQNKIRMLVKKLDQQKTSE